MADAKQNWEINDGLGGKAETSAFPIQMENEENIAARSRIKDL
jgi:hypothetical protein